MKGEVVLIACPFGAETVLIVGVTRLRDKRFQRQDVSTG